MDPHAWKLVNAVLGVTVLSLLMAKIVWDVRRGSTNGYRRIESPFNYWSGIVGLGVLILMCLFVCSSVFLEPEGIVETFFS